MIETQISKIREIAVKETGEASGCSRRTKSMPDTAAEFRAWERLMALPRVSDTADMLGVSRQTVSELRNGRCGISPPMRRLMFLLEWCRQRNISVPVPSKEPSE